MADEPDRVAVQTYVPRYQRETWREEGETQDMSLSEYVRTMVQAGRSSVTMTDVPEEPRSPGSNPWGDGLEGTIQDVLSSEGPCDWDDLREHLAGDLDDRLDEALTNLQKTGRVRHDGRAGGYVVTDDVE